MSGLSLTTLGTGTGMPDADRGTSAYLIEHGGRQLLIDVGDGTLQKLHAAGGHILTLDALIITHAHLDHLAGLFPLLFALRVPAFERSAPLHVYLSAETLTYVTKTQQVFGDWLSPGPDRVVFHTVEAGQRFDVCGLSAHTFSVCHDSSSLGFRLKSPDGATIAIPGDTGPCASLVALCQDADLVVLECALPDTPASDVHLSPGAVTMVANAAKVGHLVVVHRYKTALVADVVGTIQAQCEGTVSAAVDGQRFDVGCGPASPRPVEPTPR